MFVITSLFPVLLTKHPVRILICEPAGVKKTQFCLFLFFFFQVTGPAGVLVNFLVLRGKTNYIFINYIYGKQVTFG